jgi:hypothetical protein
MSQFCTAQGEGQKRYLEMKNRAEELLHQELSSEQKEIVGTSGADRRLNGPIR